MRNQVNHWRELLAGGFEHDPGAAAWLVVGCLIMLVVYAVVIAAVIAQ